jgi:pimeloyl-ACP methyl ester carboxylesterase
MTTSATDRIHRPDGRRVAVHDLTPDAPAGAPVVLLCHAAPGSGVFDPDPEVTAAHGIRLVSLDRPGYGGSDSVGGEAFATVDSAAEDAAAVLETVLEPGATAAVAGWSAGGRVALALAARRPELVSRVAVIGTPAPDEDVPWIPEENRAGVEALRGAPAVVAHEALTAAFGPMLAVLDGDARFGLVGIDEADGPALAEPGVADRLRAMLDAALAQGGTGMVADIAGYTLRPWGFDPADVKAPVLLGYGSADAIGPAHGEWWQRALPNARLETVPGAGHLVVVPFWKRVLADLAPRG